MCAWHDTCQKPDQACGAPNRAACRYEQGCCQASRLWLRQDGKTVAAASPWRAFTSLDLLDDAAASLAKDAG